MNDFVYVMHNWNTYITWQIGEKLQVVYNARSGLLGVTRDLPNMDRHIAQIENYRELIRTIFKANAYDIRK